MSIEIFKTKILPLKTSAFRLAYRLVGQGVDAEDIVQDTMLRMWEMRVEWEKLDCPEGYLMTVCRNLCYDFLRRKIRQRGISIDDGFDIDDEGNPLPDKIIEIDERMGQYEHILETLTPLQQAAMRLREEEEMSYCQISEKLDISQEMVKTSLFRARQKMKQMYLKQKERL